MGVEELDEAVGVGILQKQQAAAGLGGGGDVHPAVVAAEEDGVVVLLLQGRPVVEGGHALLAVHIVDRVADLRFGDVDVHPVPGGVAAGPGGEGPLEGIGHGVDRVAVQRRCADAQGGGHGRKGPACSQTGPVVVGLIEQVFVAVSFQLPGHVGEDRTGNFALQVRQV